MQSKGFKETGILQHVGNSLLLSILLLSLLTAHSVPINSAEHQGFEWQLQLHEEGLTTRVLRCTLSSDAMQAVSLTFDPGFDASEYEGIEIEAVVDRPSSFHIKATCGDPDVPLEMDVDARKEAVGPARFLTSAAKVFHIAFDEFHVPSSVTCEFPDVSPTLNEADLQSILFEPTNSEVELEIRSVALYKTTAAGIERFYIDQFSIHSEPLDAFWLGISCHGGGCEFTVLDPTITTTNSYWIIMNQGGTLEVIKDPTGNGRGLITRSTVPPRVVDGEKLASSGPKIEQWPGILVSRVYGFVLLPVQAPPCTTTVDMWVSEELLQTSLQATSGVVLLDVYDVLEKRSPEIPYWWTPSGDRVNATLQAKLWTGSIHNGKVYLDLKWAPYAHATAIPEPDAPVFTAEQWHTISIEVGKDRMAKLYQDGELVAKHQLWKDFQGGTMGGHLGLYIHDSQECGAYAVKGYVLYDNYQITCGKSTQ